MAILNPIFSVPKIFYIIQNIIILLASPFITLIVVSKNRRHFLVHAVKSALNQTLDKSLYEIIVVENSSEKKSNESFAAMGVTVIYVDEKTTGSKVTEALNFARGKVIAFLEDDDLFEEGKLQEIYDLFQDESVGYVHNNNVAIDEYGNILPGFVKGNFDHSLYVKKSSFKHKMKFMLHHNIDFNLSSISVRRRMIESTIQYWKRMKATSDSFLFYSAIMSGMTIVASDKKLTRYRIHADSLTNHLGNINDFIDRKVNFLKTLINDFKIITEMVSNTSFEKFVNKIIIQKIISIGIFDMDNVYKLRLRDYFSIFRPFSFYDAFRYNLLLMLASSLAKFRRKPVIKASYLWYRKEMNDIFSEIKVMEPNNEIPTGILR